MQEYDGAMNRRIRGYLPLPQVDTCSEVLLRHTRAIADEMRVPMALHTSESVP